MQIDMGNNRSLAWNMGTLAKRRKNPQTGESVDILTGADWNEGIASKNGTEVSSIYETIGGDDITDWARFKVNVPVQASLMTQDAIVGILNSSNRVVVSSEDAYSSELSTILEPGVYFLQFSTESSIPYVFTSQLSLTKI
jgi:hypothetical protein